MSPALARILKTIARLTERDLEQMPVPELTTFHRIALAAKELLDYEGRRPHKA